MGCNEVSRFVVIMLLIVVVFFGGFTFGSFETTANPTNVIEDNSVPVNSEQIMKEVDILPTDIVYEIEGETDRDEAQEITKTASFFENIVNGCYEFVVNLLYNFADLFF